MRISRLPHALLLAGIAGLSACAPRESEFAVDPRDIDLTGMSCAERAVALRDIIDRHEPQSDEERRLKFMVSGAEEACLQGEPGAFDEIVGIVEDRRWINDQDVYTAG